MKSPASIMALNGMKGSNRNRREPDSRDRKLKAQQVKTELAHGITANRRKFLWSGLWSLCVMLTILTLHLT